MPTPRSAQYQAILHVLADGEWHQRDELLTAGAQTVAPGRAFRVGEGNRLRRRDGARTRGDSDTSIRTGAREVTRKSLFRALKSGTVEQDGDRYRLVKR